MAKWPNPPTPDGSHAVAAHFKVFLIAAGCGLAAYAGVIGLILVFRLIGLTD
jgi:hypothetical protein